MAGNRPSAFRSSDAQTGHPRILSASGAGSLKRLIASLAARGIHLGKSLSCRRGVLRGCGTGAGLPVLSRASCTRGVDVFVAASGSIATSAARYSVSRSEVDLDHRLSRGSINHGDERGRVLLLS